jgi:hypothetical protein
MKIYGQSTGKITSGTGHFAIPHFRHQFPEKELTAFLRSGFRFEKRGDSSDAYASQEINR